MDAYWTLAERASREGERLPAPDGSALVRWSLKGFRPGSGQGPEIWAQVNAAGQVVGATPFFSTGITYRISVTGGGEDIEEPMDGWIDGWLEPAEDDEPFSGVFPLRVGLVDYTITKRRLNVFPTIQKVDLVALAHETDLFADKAAYDARPGDTYRLPVQSFVSAAHFGVDEPEPFKESTALASGYVSEASLLTNTVTQAPFWWIRLATQGVTLHVFADREVLGADPGAGQILSGSFWLLGRLA